MVQHYTSKFIAGVQDDDVNHNYGLVTGFEHRFNDPHITRIRIFTYCWSTCTSMRERASSTYPTLHELDSKKL